MSNLASVYVGPGSSKRDSQFQLPGVFGLLENILIQGPLFIRIQVSFSIVGSGSSCRLRSRTMYSPGFDARIR